MHSRTKKTLVILFVVMAITVLSAPAAHAFTGPGTLSPGSGGGKFAEDQSGNIGFNTQNTVGGTTHATPPYGNFSNVFMIAATSSPPGIALRNIGSDCGTEGCSSQPLYPSTYVWRLTPWGFLELINATDYSSYNAGPVMTFMGGSSYNRRIVVGNFYNATTSMDAALNVVGNVKSTGAFVGALSGGLAAGNVTGPASFGSNYGTYNFAFPGAVAIGTSTTTGLSSSGLYVGGSVGVGVVSPDARIHIQDAASATLKLQKTGSTASVIYDNSQLNIDSGGGQVWFADPIYMDEKTIYGDSIAGTNLTLESTSNSSKGYVILQPSGGNVGIGTTTPAYKLDVVGTGRFSGAVSVPTPSGDADAANKAYVDSVVGGGSGAGSFNTLSVSGTSTLAVTSGNVGIGTTGPEGTLHIHKATAGTITPLDTGDDLVIENDTAVGISLFSPDANSKNILFGSPTDNDFARIYGSYNSGSEYLRFNVMGNEVTINDAGNVGIGTTVPVEKLDVAGGTRIKGAASNPTGADYGRLNIDTDSSSIARFRITGATNGDYGQYQFIAQKGDATDPLTRMVISTNGNVGIGTSTPAYKLDVVGTGRFTGTVVVATPTDSTHAATRGYVDSAVTGGGGAGSFSTLSSSATTTLASSGGNLIVGTSKLFVNGTSGNVGIGTTGPGAKLEVKSGGVSKEIITAQASDGQDLFYLYENVNSDAMLYMYDTSGNNDILLHTAGSSYFNGGNVGIGTTGPTGALHVVGTTAAFMTFDSIAANYITFKEAGTVRGYIGIDSGVFTGAIADSFGIRAQGAMQLGSGVGADVTIDTSGNVGIGTSVPGSRLEIKG